MLIVEAVSWLTGLSCQRLLVWNVIKWIRSSLMTTPGARLSAPFANFFLSFFCALLSNFLGSDKNSTPRAHKIFCRWMSAVLTAIHSYFITTVLRRAECRTVRNRIRMTAWLFAFGTERNACINCVCHNGCSSKQPMWTRFWGTVENVGNEELLLIF